MVLGQNVRRWSEKRASDAQALIDWYNNGADGAINWGEEGDFEQCVAVASDHLDYPEGFCQMRHIDATGEPSGHAAGEKEDKETHESVETRTTVNGKPSRSAVVANRFLSPMIGAYKAKSAAQITSVLSNLYVAAYVAGLQGAADGVGGGQITEGIQADDSLAPLLDDSTDLSTITEDNAPSGLAELIAGAAITAGNILDYMSTDGAPSDEDQATQMTNTEAASGCEVGTQDAAIAGGFTQMQAIPDDNACEICLAAAEQPYDIGDDGPPWHPRCECESEPVGVSDDNGDTGTTSTDDTEATSALGRNVRRWRFTKKPEDFDVALEDRAVSVEAMVAIDRRVR